jgi:hypothetical protein
MDGNHKLSHWNIVITGCVDVYSRFGLYYTAITDNKQVTTLQCFCRGMHVANQQRLPLKLRIDDGTENGGIELFMNSNGRCGGVRRGDSKKNQRIESSWKFVNDITAPFAETFYHLTTAGKLNADSNLDLWCLHCVFLPIIQVSGGASMRQRADT